MGQMLEANVLVETPVSLFAKEPAFVRESISYQQIVDGICGLNWSGLSKDELTNIAWVYYYFSVQFCESVGIARNLYPDDEMLKELDAGERNTDNLSPCPGVVAVGERVDHDEFMRRTLTLTEIEPARRAKLQAMGEAYLKRVRKADAVVRTQSLASYEDGGLQRVFTAILDAPHWDDPLLQAFHHFLVGHIALDSDPDHGHGALCRHIQPTAEIVDVWMAFRESLITAAPSLLD